MPEITKASARTALGFICETKIGAVRTGDMLQVMMTRAELEQAIIAPDEQEDEPE